MYHLRARNESNLEKSRKNRGLLDGKSSFFFLSLCSFQFCSGGWDWRQQEWKTNASSELFVMLGWTRNTSGGKMGKGFDCIVCAFSHIRWSIANQPECQTKVAKQNLKKVLQDTRRICWGKKHWNYRDDVFNLAFWCLFCEATRSTRNNIKRFVIWCRPAEGVTMSNDLSGTVASNGSRDSQKELDRAIQHCFYKVMWCKTHLKTCTFLSVSKLECSAGLEESV